MYPFRECRRSFDMGTVLLLLLLDIVGVVPLGVLAWIVGRILFGAVGTSSPLLWILTALPWVLYAGAAEIDYFRTSGYPFQTALFRKPVVAILPGLIMPPVRSSRNMVRIEGGAGAQTDRALTSIAGRAVNIVSRVLPGEIGATMWSGAANCWR